MNNAYRIALILSLFGLSLLVDTGCSDDIPMVFDNPNDPSSASYIPAAPEDLAAELVGDSAVILTWKDRSRNEEGFRIELIEGTSGFSVVIDSAGANDTTYRDVRMLEAGMQYQYRVAAYSRNGISKRTEPSFVMFTTSTPKTPTVTVLSPTTVRITFSYPGPTRYYRLQRGVNGAPFTDYTLVDAAVSSTYTATIDTTTSYAFRYSATTGRNESVFSGAVHLEYVLNDASVVRSFDLGQPVHAVAVSSAGNRLAATGIGNAVKVWDLHSGSLIRDFSYHGPGIANYPWPYYCTFSADGSLLAAHCDSLSATAIRIWNIGSGATVKTLGTTGRTFAFSSDNTTLYIGNMFGELNIRNIAADSTIFQWTAHGFNNDITLVRPVTNGARLMTASYGTAENLKIWDLDPVSSHLTIGGYSTESYAVSADETLISSGSLVRDVNTGLIERMFTNSITGFVAFLADKSMLVEKRYDGQLRIHSMGSGAMIWSKSLPRANVYTYPAIASTPNPRLFVTASTNENIVDLWGLTFVWRIY